MSQVTLTTHAIFYLAARILAGRSEVMADMYFDTLAFLHLIIAQMTSRQNPVISIYSYIQLFTFIYIIPIFPSFLILAFVILIQRGREINYQMLLV